MAQRPKEHVRDAIVAAAALAFAGAGYEATTIAAVAERAGTSVGNVYRYFGNKEELFAAVLPESFASELRAMSRRRIEAFGAAKHVDAADARYHVVAGELLDHCIANRDRVTILFARAEGTPYAAYADDFANALVDWAIDYARAAWPSIGVTPALRFALGRVYANYLSGFALALSTFEAEDELRDAIAHLTDHHQGGLRRLFEVAAGEAAPRGR